MKTTSTRLFLGIFALSLSIVLLLINSFNLPSRNTESNSFSPSDFKVPPDSIYAWDVKMTLPPGKEIIPQEELINAYGEMEALMGTGTESIDSVNWIEMGPTNIGGRTRAILIDANDTTGQTIWAGGISGGLWKSTNGGNSWTVINDFFENLAVSSL
jgi:hypothetical protein